MNVTNHDEKRVESILSVEVDEAQRQAVRENAKRVLQESGLAEMLKTLNKNALKGRGRFYEYDFRFSSNGEQVTLVAICGLKLAEILFDSGLLLIASVPSLRQSVMVNIIRLRVLCGQIGNSC